MKIRILTPGALAFAVLGLAACSNNPSGPTDVLTSSTTSATNGPGTTGPIGSSGQPTATRVRLIAPLTPPAGAPFAGAKGEASWDSRNNNTKRELEMEVEHLPAALAVDFFVSGVKIGSATTDALGHASIHFSTELGQPVPTAAAGLPAQIRTSSGVVVVTGNFPTS